MRIPNKVTALLSAAMILVTATNPAALLTATAADVNYGPIHVVPNTLEVEKSDTSFMKQYPTGQTLKFSAARNERESGQIIIHSDNNIDEITVDTAALFNGSSKIPKENIEVFFEQYEYVASNAYILQEMEGYHADALLPYKIACDKNVRLNKMDSGNQGIWFTVTVPEDAQAGTYSGNFTVTLDEKTYTLPVQFTVYDFNLPEQTNYKNFYKDYTATNEKVYSEMAGYTDTKNYSDDLADFLNQRRLSTGYPKASFGWILGNPEAQLDAYTQSVYDYVTTSASPYYNLEYDDTLGSYPPSARPLSNILFTFEFELSNDYSKYMDNREELDAAIKTKAEQLITKIETSLGIELSDAEKQAVLDAANGSLYYNVKSYTHTLTEDEYKLISLDSKGTDYYLTSYDDEHKPSNIEWNERFYYALKLLDTPDALNVAHNFSLIAFPFELTNDYSQYKDNRDKLDAAIEAKAKDIITVIEAASGIKLSSGEKRAVLDAANGFLYYNVKYNTHTLTEDEKKLISLTPTGTKYYQENYDGNHEVQTLSNTEWIKRLYNALMLLGTSDALDVARYCHYKSHTRYCQYDMKYYFRDEKNNVAYVFGLQTILKALVKKSLETNTDLLQYAYFYSTQTDEPAPNDFWANYAVLATSCSFENSKKAAQKDINNYSGCSQKFKDQLTESLNNIVYFSTTSPGISITSTYTESYYTSDSAPAYNCILTKGLKSLEELGINDYAKYTNDFVEYDIYINGYESGKEPSKGYTCSIPSNYTVNAYCPLFNDFSDAQKPYECAWEGVAKDYPAVVETLENDNVHLWWYNCNSDMSPALASYIIGGNIAYNYDADSHEREKKNGYQIQGNSLAIARANKWQQFKMGIEGELYWAVDDYKLDRDKKAYNHDVWTSVSEISAGCQGVLVYPIYSLLTYSLKQMTKSQEKPKENMTPNTAKEFIENHNNQHFASSIRLENVSEAADDYDYLCMAEQYAQGNPEFEALLDKIICTIIEPYNVDYTDSSLTNSENLAKAREMLASFIILCQTNEMLNKATIMGLGKDNDIKNWRTKFNSVFTEMTDKNAEYSSIIKATTELTSIHSALARRTSQKAIRFEVSCGEPIYIDFEASNRPVLTEKIMLDCTNCQSTVGTITKNMNSSSYEIIIPIDDLPMINAIATDYTEMRSFGFRNGEYTTSVSISQMTTPEVVDVVQPITKNGYVPSTFYTQILDESVKDWKTGNQGVAFEFKPIDLNADTEREENTIAFNFNQTDWKGTTKYYTLNVAEGIAKIGNTTLQAEKCADGWYRLVIPFKILEATEDATINYSIDILSFRWITHSAAIRNVRVWKEASGDLNDDGILDKSDVTMLEAFLVGNGHLTLELWEEADYDHNGVLNVIDLTLMKRAIL